MVGIPYSIPGPWGLDSNQFIQEKLHNSPAFFRMTVDGDIRKSSRYRINVSLHETLHVLNPILQIVLRQPMIHMIMEEPLPTNDVWVDGCKPAYVHPVLQIENSGLTLGDPTIYNDSSVSLTV